MAYGIRRRGCREVTTIEGAGVEEERLASGGGGPSGTSTSQRRQRRRGGGVLVTVAEERHKASGVGDEAPVMAST
jgi:hypothetical protein